jgi:hypothetical protein
VDGTWIDYGSSLLSGSSFSLRLVSPTRAGQLWKSIRTRLVYLGNNTTSSGPWSLPVAIPLSTVWTDGTYCVQKRQADALLVEQKKQADTLVAEQKKLADAEIAKQLALPGTPIVSAVVYESDSTIKAKITKPTKNATVQSYSVEQTFDGSTWIPSTSKLVLASGSSTVWNLTLTVSDTSKNVSFIRVKANNSIGSGPWVEAPTGRENGLSAITVERSYSSDGYSLFTNPIALPGNASSPQTFATGCTFTSLELSELSSSGIQIGDSFTLETSLEEREFKSNSAPQLSGNGGVRLVTANSTGAEISTIALRVQLCLQDIQEFQPRYLRVKISKVGVGPIIEGKIKVLRNEITVAQAIENAKHYCGLGVYGKSSASSFNQNLVIEQTRIQKTPNDFGVVRGTLFRSGLIAASQQFQVFRIIGGVSTPIATAITDNKGQFEIKVKLPKTKNGSTQKVTFFAGESASKAGLLNEPFATVEVPISLVWTTKGLVYQKGTTDWVPSNNPVCLTNIASLSKAEDDERQPVAWFVAKQVYYGMKNKATKSYSAPVPASKGPTRVPTSGSSSYNSSNSPSIGKRCYVRGYTTKSGKRVGGYSRRC